MTAELLEIQARLVKVGERVAQYPEQFQGFVTDLLSTSALIERPPRDWAWQSYVDLLLAKGQLMQQELFVPDELGAWPAQQCYANSYELAMEYPGELTYVEGVAFSSFLPVSHAWLIDCERNIVDVTWANLEPEFCQKPIYLGIEFAPDFLLRHVVSTGWHSVLNTDWQFDHQVLRRGLKFNDAGQAIDLGPEE